MNDAALEIRDALELRRVALLVAVIAAAQEQKIAAEAHGRVVFSPLRLDGPARILRRPRRARHAVGKTDVLLDAVVLRGLANVVQDCRTRGNGLVVGPRLERIAEREHVRIRADAGIAEQIPGAADRCAPFQDRVALVRAFLLQVIGGADARKPGADDQHVDMFGCHGRLLGHRH
jgi:hypothetical protein